MRGFTSLVNQRFFWNTKCPYTEHGQRIGAYWDGTHIHYVDVDRGCNGSFRCSNVDSEYFLKDYVQVVYDRPIGHRHILLDCEACDALEKETSEKAPSMKREKD